MPRFAANLSMLFTEWPLVERFAAAAAAGFRAVELQEPYEVSASAVRAELERHRLTMLGINTALGQPGEFGVAAVPGREREFAGVVRQALEYAAAIRPSGITTSDACCVLWPELCDSSQGVDHSAPLSFVA